jgi:hypothetical protein
MLIFKTSPLSCRIGRRPDLDRDLEPIDDLCAFEFPRCLGCRKSPEQPKPETGDPMTSTVSRGWLGGMVPPVAKNKEAAAVVLDALDVGASPFEIKEFIGMTA